MAKEKVTITLDRAKAEAARGLVGAASTSEVIDIALERLLRAERLRRDVEAYRRFPQTVEERAVAEHAASAGLFLLLNRRRPFGAWTKGLHAGRV
jgi:hypothetical protein